MEMIKKIQHFIYFWYVRYLLATELYMVETWEKLVYHSILAVLFGIVWIINYSVVMTAVAKLRTSAANWQEIL